MERFARLFAILYTNVVIAEKTAVLKMLQCAETDEERIQTVSDGRENSESIRERVDSCTVATRCVES